MRPTTKDQRQARVRESKRLEADKRRKAEFYTKLRKTQNGAETDEPEDPSRFFTPENAKAVADYFQRQRELRKANQNKGGIVVPSPRSKSSGATPETEKSATRSASSGRKRNNKLDRSQLTPKANRRLQNRIARARGRREALRRDAWYASPSGQPVTGPSVESRKSMDYTAIKSAVANAYKRLMDNGVIRDNDLINQFSAEAFVLAAVAPASTVDERKQAIRLIQRLGRTDVITLLVGSLPDVRPSSVRRTNLLFALTELGETGELADFLRMEAMTGRAKELQWSVLPPGWWHEAEYTDQIIKKTRSGQLILERLKYIDQLNPLERWRGQDRFGSDPYWVFVFANHVVAECPSHGNAVYVIKGIKDWRNLLSRSKTNLLKNFPQRVVRIIHTGNWQLRLRRVLSIQ